MDLNYIVLVMIDECEEEVEVDRFKVGTDLDEDYMALWEEMKLNDAWEAYPEARGFYFEDRREWRKAITWL